MHRAAGGELEATRHDAVAAEHGSVVLVDDRRRDAGSGVVEHARGTATTQTPDDGRSAAAINNAGYAMLPGDPQGALPLLARAVEKFRAAGDTRSLDYAFSLYNYGWALRLAGRPAEAIPLLRGAPADLQVQARDRAQGAQDGAAGGGGRLRPGRTQLHPLRLTTHPSLAPK